MHTPNWGLARKHLEQTEGNHYSTLNQCETKGRALKHSLLLVSKPCGGVRGESLGDLS